MNRIERPLENPSPAQIIKLYAGIAWLIRKQGRTSKEALRLITGNDFRTETERILDESRNRIMNHRSYLHDNGLLARD